MHGSPDSDRDAAADAFEATSRRLRSALSGIHRDHCRQCSDVFHLEESDGQLG